MTQFAMTEPSSAESLKQRFPEVFHQSPVRRHMPLIVIAGLVLYFLYVGWFFSLPTVMKEAHWDRFSTYLVQWISYDVQIEFRLDAKGAVEPKYSRFGVLGLDPHPDWVIANPDGSYTVQMNGPNGAVTFGKDKAMITGSGQNIPVQLAGLDTPAVAGTAPDWVEIKGDQVTAEYGFAGEVRMSPTRVKVQKRFLGWANFIFDPLSPFFNRSPGEVASLIAFGPDLKPGVSNWSLAFDNIWYNNQWQHGDVWTKLLQTIVMAFLGTLCGAIVAFPLAFLAARNITASGVLNQGVKRFFDFLRSVDMLIWALFFTRAFGPGPLSGSAAIFLTEVGTLGKIYSEGLENIDDKQREGVQSTGASPLAVQRFGVLPQVIPVMISQTLYQWESNTRGAAIIGAVGAGGIGLKLWESMRTNSNWANVFYMVLLILAVVFTFDAISNALRSRLIGKRH